MDAVSQERRPVSIGAWVNVAAATTSVVDFYRVPGGYNFIVEEVQASFPAGTAGELALAFFVGPTQILPTVGSYFGDGSTVSDKTIVIVQQDGLIQLKATNSNTTGTRSAYILVRGYLVR
jgi:hypothetical protein